MFIRVMNSWVLEAPKLATSRAAKLTWSCCCTELHCLALQSRLLGYSAGICYPVLSACGSGRSFACAVPVWFFPLPKVHVLVFLSCAFAIQITCRMSSEGHLPPSPLSRLQTASAAALSLLAARDLVVQDSVRYLGGIDHLVNMLSSPDQYLAQVAR